MQSILQPRHYTDPAVFEQERRTIFRKLWLFASVRSALSSPNAYVALQLAGLPVLLQNCEGEIRAFANQCPHRLMPLQADGAGQARMTCPYHGWTFNHDGSVRAIPNEHTLYRYSPQERQALCLKRYSVELVGNLVFVNLDTDPLPIESQFSADMLERLRDISSHFGNVAVQSNIEAAYNWKLQYENVLDYNHVPYVHTKSFLPLLARKKSKDDILPAESTPLHRESAAPADTVEPILSAQSHHMGAALNIPVYPWHQQVRRYGPGGMFENIFLFPNINFNCAEGLIFKIEQYEPLSPDRTLVRFTMMIAEETQRIHALPAILRGCLRNDVNVLYEDMQHLENLQKSLHTAESRSQHGAYEKYLVSFAAVYNALLKGEQPWK